MVQAAFLQPRQPPTILSTVDEIKGKLNAESGFLWVNLDKSSNEEINTILSEVFQFHSLAIEDCQSTGYQTSKIDDYSDYIFLIAHAIDPSEDFTALESIELDFFLGNNFLVTCSADNILTNVSRSWDLIQKDYRLSKNGPDFLCHSILDSMVDDYLPVIDQMETEVEWLEDSVLEKPTPETLQRLLSLKHSIMALRRIVAPQREVMNRLSRDEFSQIDEQSRIYFRDIYDHLVRILDLTDILRDIISGALDIYLNSTSLRLNEIMKALTIVSTVFLPLSFIAGVFGMNFLHIPGASSPLGFYITVLLMVVLGVAMLLYFRKRHWF